MLQSTAIFIKDSLLFADKSLDHSTASIVGLFFIEGVIKFLFIW